MSSNLRDEIIYPFPNFNGIIQIRWSRDCFYLPALIRQHFYTKMGATWVSFTQVIYINRYENYTFKITVKSPRGQWVTLSIITMCLNITHKSYSHISQGLMSQGKAGMWGHDDVIKWKHFLHYWPFVQGIHRSPVNSPHKGQWPGALMFSLICVWINGCVNNREAGDLRRYRAHYDVIVMKYSTFH